MKRTHFFALLTMILFTLNGCGLAVMTTVDTARGGTSEFFVVEPVQNLQTYENIYIIPFTSAIGEQFNQELLAHMNDKILVDLSENGIKHSQSGQLKVSGTVINLTDGVIRKRVLVQVKFQDAITDQSIGLVNITGKANRIRGLTAGVDAVAAGVIKLLAENNFPGMEDPS